MDKISTDVSAKSLSQGEKIKKPKELQRQIRDHIDSKEYERILGMYFSDRDEYVAVYHII